MEKREEAQNFQVPMVQQPRGFHFFIGTWSGRLLVANTVIFILMAIESESLLMPAGDVLIRYGAKEPVLLAQGEFWRLVSPLFVHIGLVHFVCNSWALYVFSYQIESLLKGKWFLMLYLLSGIMGNVASSVFSVAVSAGASGSLFGLLGSGLVVEKVIGRYMHETTGIKPKMGMYSGLVGINLLLGVVIPQIDNAAHIGGLVTGMGFTFFLLTVKPNRLVRPSKVYSGLTILCLLIAGISGIFYGTSSVVLQNRFVKEGEESERLNDRYFYFSQALRIDPDHLDVLLKRGTILLLSGEKSAAAADFELLLKDSYYVQELQELYKDLYESGNLHSAIWLKHFISGAEDVPWVR